MFSLLQPILLFAAAGIAIPVIIHLWNIRQGKTLKVGSISLLVAGAKQSARSLKLHDFLLLFLRCLLIALLAFLLAKPTWQKDLSVKKEKGWILLEKESLHESYQRNKSNIDSLQKAGYTLHYFEDGFQKGDLQSDLEDVKDTVVRTNTSYWNLLKSLNQNVPADLPVVLFVKNSLNRFSGERPTVALNVDLQTYGSADTTSTWISKAFVTATGSIKLIIGHSTPLRTYYTETTSLVAPATTSNYKINVEKGKLSASLNTNNTLPHSIDTNAVEVDTASVRIFIFSDKYRNDASYVRAAIESIKKFSQRKIEVKTTSNVSDISSNTQWLFWLSDQSLPSNVSAKNVLIYKKGKLENIASWIKADEGLSTNDQQISLVKSFVKNNPLETGQNVWTDGFGNALLNKRSNGDQIVYSLYTRFDPQWNDLVWDQQFPLLVHDLMLGTDDINRDLRDKRIIDAKQILPVIQGKNERVIKQKFLEKLDLTFYFWLTAFVTLFIERIVSYRFKKGVSYA